MEQNETKTECICDNCQLYDPYKKECSIGKEPYNNDCPYFEEE